jgi:hypothetical protein
MTGLARICAAALLVTLCGCGPEPAPTETALPPAPMPAPHKAAGGGQARSQKPEPTQQELADYVRGKLLQLSPNDGINDNQDVSFDAATGVLSVTQPDGRCDIFLGAIDSSSLLWETFDPSDTYHPRAKVLRVTMTSLGGQKARTCYDEHSQVDASLPKNRARLLFSLPKTEVVPNFQPNMNKALKKLVLSAGGAPEKDIFAN